MYIKQILFSVCVVAGVSGTAVHAFDDGSLDNYDVEIIRPSSQEHGADDSIVVATEIHRDKKSSEKKPASVPSESNSTATPVDADNEWVTEPKNSVTAAEAAVAAGAAAGANATATANAPASGGRDLGVGCSKPAPIPDVVVDTPKIPRTDLTAVASVYTVAKGDTVGKLVNTLLPEGSGVTHGQLLAALLRANPKTFNGGNLQIGSKIAVPSAERIALESDKTGKDILSRINAGKMSGYVIPALSLPWDEEDARIAKQKSDKAQRDQKVKKQQDDYLACVESVKRKKEEAERKKAQELEEARKAAEKKAREEWEMANTEADLADEDFMIKDPEEEKAQKQKNENVVLNEQGKRVIVLKQEKKQSAKEQAGGASGGRLIGANIVFNGRDVYARDSSGHTVKSDNGGSSAELDRMRKELADAQNVNQALLDEKIRQTEKISRLEEQFEGLSSKLDNIAHMQSVQISDAAEARQQREQASEQENGSTSWIWIILGILAALAAYGTVIVPKMRNNRALREKLESSPYGKIIIDNPLSRKCQEIKARLRTSLLKFLENSEQKEQEMGERIAMEEKEKAEQDELEARKPSVFFKKDESMTAAAEDVGAEAAADTPEPEVQVVEKQEEERDYQPTSMVIEIESEPVVPVGFSEEEQLDIPPSTNHGDDIVATSENPEPKTVD